MSYSIIFETKFVKLSDGRLLHLDRRGCNNDDSGRDLSDFEGEIYTEEELKVKAEKYMTSGKTEENILKISGKWTDMYGYGEHLLRMAKRATLFEQFVKERYFYGERFDGVELIKPEVRKMTPEEFDKYYYSTREPFSWRRLITKLNNECDIIQAIENKEPISFYVGKKYKCA